MAQKEPKQPGSSPFEFHSSNAAVPGLDESAAAQAEPDSAQSTQRKARRRGKTDAQANSLFAAPKEQSLVPGAQSQASKRPFARRSEADAYMMQLDERYTMDHGMKVMAVSLAATLLLVVLVPILPTGLFGSGRGIPSIPTVVEAFSNNVSGLVNWLTGGPVTTGISVTFWQTVAAAIVGAVLALNGCVFQGALKNALAAPSTLGVMSGGTLGTLVFTLLFGIPTAGELFTVVQASELQEQMAAMDLPSYIFATQGRALFSMAGCFVIVALVLIIAHIAGHGKVSKVGLLIAGQVFTALIAGVVSVVRYYIMFYGTEEQLAAIQQIVGGSITAFTTPLSLLPMLVPVVIGTVIIMALRFKLNLLAFNDDEAKSMGINTTFTRNAVIVVCTVLTGVVVSYVGAVGFVGFLVPHMARKVVGPDFRQLIPTSMLFGAMFLVLANYLMNLTSIFSGSIGTLTAIIGAISFLVIATYQRARGNVDWI